MDNKNLLASFIQDECWWDFVEYVSENREGDPEVIAEEIITALKGE